MVDWDGFKTLKKGWDTYEAEPPNDLAIENAKRFINLFDLKPTRIAASVIGGIGITFRQIDEMIYIEFGNDGRNQLLYANELKEPFIKEYIA
jgi:hypothetical protein